jgi:phage shock protein A
VNPTTVSEQVLKDALERIQTLEYINASLEETLQDTSHALNESKLEVRRLEKIIMDYEYLNPPTIHLSPE